MQVPQPAKDEHGCRVCKRFTGLHTCWLRVAKFGSECKAFDRDPRRFQLIPRSQNNGD